MAEKKKDKNISFDGQIIIDRSMDQVMHDSMMPYAEHVILERALPRVEDGLKPVQRRILYTMMELGNTPDKPYRKSARIVGDCLGKYHPHGDSSVYDATVRMAQDFNMCAPLVDGHGNFGSVDGDSAAAMRYTECRMTPFAMELLRDLEKDTVKFNLNFDDTLKEPDVLPGHFPNLMVNGASGIAVGLATNIPPHNIEESIDAVVAMIDDPDISLDEVMKLLPCPDFPTGAYLLQSPEIREAFRTGRGRLVLRAKTHMEPQKNGRTQIVITEMPYQVNKASALERILRLTQEKKSLFAGITDIRDESDRTGMRAVIEVKKDVDAEKVLEYLFKYSDLQTSFGVNMVAIAEGKPQQLGILDIIRHYIRHQREVTTRRTRHDLENAEKREHVLAGLMIALDNLDEVIALIRASKSPKAAKEGLMARFALTEVQAQTILDLRLQRLTNMERLAIEREYKEVGELIKELKAILASDAKLCEVIKTELLGVKAQFPMPRRTQLINAQEKIVVAEEDMRTAEDVAVLLYSDLRIRRMPKRLYNPAALEEAPQFAIETDTLKRIKLFTNLGYVLTVAVEDVQEQRGAARPMNLNALIPIESGESIVAAFAENEVESGELLFYTSSGNVKLTDAKEYSSKTKRIAAIGLKDDELINVHVKRPDDSILMISAKAMSINFPIETVPAMGRVSTGVKGMKLDNGDRVVFAQQVSDEGEMLLISDRGYAKRCFMFEYDLQGRNGKGQRTFDFKKNGSNGTKLAVIMPVKEPFDVEVAQARGERTIVNTDTVRIEDRASKGQPIVMALLDDVVTGGVRKESAPQKQEQ